MKFLLYLLLALVVVPFQTTLLHYFSIFGVRPDLGLVAACLVGFLGGELDGLILGLLLGCFQDMLSAGDLWINVVTKGGGGFLAIISCLSSAVFLYSMNPAGIDEVWMGVRSTVLVQAGFDALVGTGLYLLFRQRWSDDRMVTEGAL